MSSDQLITAYGDWNPDFSGHLQLINGAYRQIVEPNFRVSVVTKSKTYPRCVFYIPNHTEYDSFTKCGSCGGESDICLKFSSGGYLCNKCAKIYQGIIKYGNILAIGNTAFIDCITYRKMLHYNAIITPSSVADCSYCGSFPRGNLLISCIECANVLGAAWRLENFPKYLLLSTNFPVDILHQLFIYTVLPHKYYR
jgi:hypothetical protein